MGENLKSLVLQHFAHSDISVSLNKKPRICQLNFYFTSDMHILENRQVTLTY